MKDVPGAADVLIGDLTSIEQIRGVAKQANDKNVF
jgi:hypothetical protein